MRGFIATTRGNCIDYFARLEDCQRVFNSEKSRMITHVVFFWLNETNQDQQAKLLEGAASLATIPGVIGFRSGIPIPSDRPVVDSSYSVGISMSFQDQEAADAYQDHPVHEAFIEQYVKPMVAKVVVYDFGTAT